MLADNSHITGDGWYDPHSLGGRSVSSEQLFLINSGRCLNPTLAQWIIILVAKKKRLTSCNNENGANVPAVCINNMLYCPTNRLTLGPMWGARLG